MVQKYPAVGEIVQWLPDTNEDWQFGRIVDFFHDETSKLARFVTECLPVKYTRGNVSSYKVGHVVVSPDLDSKITGDHVVIPVEAFFTDKKDVANFWVARVWDNVPIESRIIAISKRFDSNFSILRKHEPQTLFKLKEAIEHIFRELDGTEGLLIASKIADRVGITRSVIVNALRKLESAGIIESKSLGMKGTYIKVLKEYFLELMFSNEF